MPGPRPAPLHPASLVDLMDAPRPATRLAAASRSCSLAAGRARGPRLRRRAAAGHPTPVAGTSDAPREVNLIAKDYSFLPATLDLFPGETVLLHVINGGLEVHEAVIGDAAVQDAWEAAEAATAGAPPGPTPRRQRPARRRRACASSSAPASGSTSAGPCRRDPAGAGAGPSDWTVGCHIPGHLAKGMSIPIRWVGGTAHREGSPVVRSRTQRPGGAEHASPRGGPA